MKRFDYQNPITDDENPRAAEIVAALTNSGIGLLAFSEFPHSPGKLQVDLIGGDTRLLAEAAGEMGWKLSERKSGFLIQGEDRPNAIGKVLRLLADAGIRVTAVQAIAVGAGRFGALLWVRPADVEPAAMALHSAMFGPVDESFEQSFPASDAPVWTLPAVR